MQLHYERKPFLLRKKKRHRLHKYMEPFYTRICLAYKEQFFFAHNHTEQVFYQRNLVLPDRKYPVAKVSAPGVS